MGRPLPEYSQEALSLHIGAKYEHYKKMPYLLLAIARHSETLEELVVYQAQYGERGVWVRPLKMFIEKIELDGAFVPRFRHVK